jgi:hypothetical protein
VARLFEGLFQKPSDWFFSCADPLCGFYANHEAIVDQQSGCFCANVWERIA